MIFHHYPNMYVFAKVFNLCDLKLSFPMFWLSKHRGQILFESKRLSLDFCLFFGHSCTPSTLQINTKVSTKQKIEHIQPKLQLVHAKPGEHELYYT